MSVNDPQLDRSHTRELVSFPPPVGKASSTTSHSAALATGDAVSDEERESAAKEEQIEEGGDMLSDKDRLVKDDDDLSEEISSEDSDEDNRTWHRRRRSTKYHTPKWWFQDRKVKGNWCIVLGVWLMMFLSIVCFVTGIALEIVNHTTSFDVVRGFIFIIIAVVIFIPSVYGVIHIYLAAKRVGRVKMSSVWFFVN